MNITYDHFSQVEIRSGTITKVEPFERARKPAYKIWADFGPAFGIKQTSAQVTVHYTAATLMGKQIMGCLNLGPKNIAGFTSEFLLLGFPDAEGAIVLPVITPAVPNGQKLC
jgi:tRNA-binding protein